MKFFNKDVVVAVWVFVSPISLSISYQLGLARTRAANARDVSTPVGKQRFDRQYDLCRVNLSILRMPIFSPAHYFLFLVFFCFESVEFIITPRTP